MSVSPADQRDLRKQRIALTLWIALALYALVVLALRGNLLLESWSRMGLPLAIMQFLFPLTVAELVLLAFLAVTMVRWWRAQRHVEGTSAVPNHPGLWQDPPWKASVALGWSLVWRLYLAKLIAHMAILYVPSQPIRWALSVAFLGCAALLAVYLLRRQARRQYAIRLPWLVWPFLWRGALVFVIGEVILALFLTLVSPDHVGGQLTLLTWAGVYAVLALSDSVAIGWAARRAVAVCANAECAAHVQAADPERQPR